MAKFEKKLQAWSYLNLDLLFAGNVRKLIEFWQQDAFLLVFSLLNQPIEYWGMF